MVDGPWKLTSFDASGNVTMVANPTYSGPIKPTIKTFIEVPFTSDSAEFNALVGGKVDVGLPAHAGHHRHHAPNSATPGPNNPRLRATTTSTRCYTWSINYFPYNFNSTGDGGNAGKIFKPAVLPPGRPVPGRPAAVHPEDLQGLRRAAPTARSRSTRRTASSRAPRRQNNPYPYNPTQGRRRCSRATAGRSCPAGSRTCADPGTGANQCGAGIPAGAKLDFNLQYASGSDAVHPADDTRRSHRGPRRASREPVAASFNTVIGNAVPCTGSACTWELGNWGAGWIFAPDYYPTGESIFQTGAGSNSGSYSDATNDANILATNTTNTPLTTYENYLAKQLPVVFQPNSRPPSPRSTRRSTEYTPSTLQQLNPGATGASTAETRRRTSRLRHRD